MVAAADCGASMLCFRYLLWSWVFRCNDNYVEFRSELRWEIIIQLVDRAKNQAGIKATSKQSITWGHRCRSKWSVTFGWSTSPVTNDASNQPNVMKEKKRTRSVDVAFYGKSVVARNRLWLEQISMRSSRVIRKTSWDSKSISEIQLSLICIRAGH